MNNEQLKEIETKECRYLNKYYHFLKFAEDECWACHKKVGYTRTPIAQQRLCEMLQRNNITMEMGRLYARIRYY